MTELSDIYYSQCLKADLSPVLPKLLIHKSKNKKDKILKKKILNRFGFASKKSKVHCKDSFISSTIQIYHEYYKLALTQPSKHSLIKIQLTKNLNELAIKNGLIKNHKMSQEQVEVLFKKVFKENGFESIFGSIKPFRSLVVWKKTTLKNYTVKLTHGYQAVRVHFLNDVIERSWLHFATFGKYCVGGWATDTALYCLKERYNLKSDRFKSHYLAHEAQHLYDLKSKSKFDQTELEFRAKLAELASTKTPNRFLNKLRSESKNDKKLPHSYAANKVLLNFPKEKRLKPSKVRQMAREILLSMNK